MNVFLQTIRNMEMLDMDGNRAQELRPCLCMTPETISGGETHCRQRRGVFGYEAPASIESPSKPSLFLRGSIGGESGHKPAHVKNFHTYNGINAAPNTCGKLKLLPAIENGVRLAYKELREYCMSKPKTAVCAIYRMNGLPFGMLSHAEPRFHASIIPNLDTHAKQGVARALTKIKAESLGCWLFSNPMPGISIVALYRIHSSEVEA